MLSTGSLVVTDSGDLVMLTSGDVEYGDLNTSGAVTSWRSGALLLRNGQFMNLTPYKVRTHRVVGHIRELIEGLAERVDVSTPAEKPDSELTPLERIAKLERENAALKSAVGIR